MHGLLTLGLGAVSVWAAGAVAVYLWERQLHLRESLPPHQARIYVVGWPLVAMIALLGLALCMAVDVGDAIKARRGARYAMPPRALR